LNDGERVTWFERQISGWLVRGLAVRVMQTSNKWASTTQVQQLGA
jgi:hypothetical protein